MEKLKEKFQVLKAKKISLDEMELVHEASDTDSATENEHVKFAEKIFSYYDNITMKEDMDGFFRDDRATNTVIDSHNYILKEEETNLDHQNFYLSAILFASYKNY
ncbi:unnamed protein product [Malus baccata var. baccata]